MADGAGPPVALSKRELEVAEAYASGGSYKEIARDLGLAPTTIRSHLRTVYGKLGVTSKIELAQTLDNQPVPKNDRDKSDMVADLALELDEAVRRERVLAKVLKIISQEDSHLEPVIDAVLEYALEICEAEFGILFEYEGDFRFRELQSRNISPAFADWLAREQIFKVEPGTGIGRVAANLETVNIADVRGEDIYQSGAPLRIATADLGKARSFAAIPMMSGDRLIGAFTVYRTRVHPFHDHTLELAQVFADQAVIAIENARRFKALQSRLERESVNQQILRVINESRADEQPVFEVIAENAVHLCKAQFCMLWRYDGTDVHYCASHGFTDAFMAAYLVDYPMPPEPNGIVYQAIQAGRTVHLPNAQADPYSDAPIARHHGYDYMLGIPVKTDNGIWGVMVLAWPEGIVPGADQVDLLETFAAQAVIAIKNASQFRELQSRLERETVNKEILQVISESPDDDQPVFDFILKNACRLCEADFGAFVMGQEGGGPQIMVATTGVNDETLALYREGQFTMEAGRSNAADAILGRKVIQIEDLSDHPLYRRNDPRMRYLVDEQGIRTNLYVPLISKGAGIGCLILWRRNVRRYTTDQIGLVETFAAQAVIAIENVRQFNALQARLEREQGNAEILQLLSRSREGGAPVFDIILQKAAALCDADAAALTLGKEGDTHQRLGASLGVHEATIAHYESGRVSMTETSYAARAILSGEPVPVEDFAATDGYREGDAPMRSLVDDTGMRSSLFVPLMTESGGIGALILFRKEVRPFSNDEISLVRTFADQAVIAINNANLFDEVQTRLEREAATREVLSVISRSRSDDAPVFDTILENAQRLCGAPFGNLNMVTKDGSRLEIVADGIEPFEPFRPGWSWPIDSGLLVARSVRECAVHQLEDAALDPLYGQGDTDRVTVVESGVRTVLTVPLISNGEGIGSMGLYRREKRPFTPDEIALVQTFAEQAVIAIENVRQFKALKATTEEVRALNTSLEAQVEEQVGEIERMGRLKRFLSPAVADALVLSGDEARLASHRALIATLFCDIRGFTAFCETAEPEETIEVLQAYHEEMGTLISAYGGGVDKRMGDGIMVIFNDPLPCEDPAGDAVRLAIAMRKKMVDLCKGWKRLGHRLGFGVGISLGYATIGMVGSEGRYDYTASGTAVNLAARLCDRALDGEILLSPRAATAVEDDLDLESSGEIDLKGLREPVEVFRLKSS